MDRCLFCSIPGARIVLQNDAAIAVEDGYPVSRGHLRVIPRRHVASVYDLGRSEQEAIWVLVRAARHKIGRDLEPDGFNVGLNDGRRPAKRSCTRTCT